MSIACLLLDLTALVGGTVHSMVPGAQPVVATVLIEDGRIKAVGADLELPEDCERYDATGMHVIPGLIDGLAHHDVQHDLLYTSAGISVVRDHGNDLARIFEVREPEMRDALAGPSLSICGAAFDGSPPSTPSAIVTTDEHQAHQLVPALIEQGVDFIAVQVGLPEAAWRETLELAHAEEPPLQVWGPVPRAVDLEAVLAAGQDGVLFLDALLPAGESWADIDPAALAPVIARLSAAKTRIVPLLRGSARVTEGPDDAESDLFWLDPQFAAHWRADLQARAGLLADEELVRTAGEVLVKQREVVAALHAAGAVLVPGSGAPHPMLAPGVGLHREMREWVAAGLTPGEVLALATAGAAEALELEQRGTIEPGHHADLVVLGQDPTADLAALGKVDLVVLRGNVLQRSQLDEMLTTLQTRLQSARERLDRAIEVAAPTLPEGTVLLSGRTKTSSTVGNIAAERWAIVRELDDSITFVGRRLIPGGTGVPDVEVHCSQRLHKGALAGFLVRLNTAGRELVVRGLSVGGQMRVERRLDGAHVDTKAAREKLVAIDAGSVTTLMLLAHTQGPGHFPVLRFDQGLELEVVRWDLALDEDGDHVFRTPRGFSAAGFQENGALKAVLEESAGSAVTTSSMEIDDHAGPGLPLPADKLALMQKQGEPAEAGAPAPPPAPPPSDG
jgi:hypothetical protein